MLSTHQINIGQKKFSKPNSIKSELIIEMQNVFINFSIFYLYILVLYIQINKCSLWEIVYPFKFN